MKQVHSYTVDRATSTARLGAVSPIRKFIRGPLDEVPPVVVQLAHGELQFYDQGGQPMALEDVPQEVLDSLKSSPLRRGNESIEQVMKFCKWCPENDNAVASADWENHLHDHIRQAGTNVRRVEPVEAAPVEEPVAAKPRTVAKAKGVKRGKK